MRFAFIDAEKANYSVALLSRVLKVTRSGYYAWRSRPESERARSDRALLAHIRSIHKESGGVSGAPGVKGELKNRGQRVSKKRVARLMRENGLRGVPEKRFQKTTDSKHSSPVSPNLLKDREPPTAPNQVWASDIAFVESFFGKLKTEFVYRYAWRTRQYAAEAIST